MKINEKEIKKEFERMCEDEKAKTYLKPMYFLYEDFKRFKRDFKEAVAAIEIDDGKYMKENYPNTFFADGDKDYFAVSWLDDNIYVLPIEYYVNYFKNMSFEQFRDWYDTSKALKDHLVEGLEDEN